ncbi:hypothetical protein LTS18_009443 [Coniosporium uncinatum]|uniref:Uncharacterized protein n=1 Tax=Coniosporium uncinatum TaxID=93489 RepID=A0ACC3D9X7_9PEZI|nr:hypothetical protein LTS18_009443 [Coniosporium uncinatum]
MRKLSDAAAGKAAGDGDDASYTDTKTMGTGGLLSPIGDPIGAGLNTVLSPVGHVVSGITGSVQNATAPYLAPMMGRKDERSKEYGGTGGKPLKMGKTKDGEVKSTDGGAGENKENEDGGEGVKA